MPVGAWRFLIGASFNLRFLLEGTLELKFENENDAGLALLKSDTSPKKGICALEQEQIFKYFYSLLFSPTPMMEIPECIRDDPEAWQIVHTLQELREALRMASKGDFSYKVTVKGFMGGTLKSLQANLNHIAWLTRRVADGDLEQRMDFIGEFSAAFNSMTEQLSTTLEELKRKQESLERLTEELQREVEVRKATEEKLRKEEERWQLAVHCSRDGIWDVDLEQEEPPYYSPRLLELTGFKPQKKASIRDWAKLLHPDDKETRVLFRSFLSKPNSSKSFSIDHRLLCGDRVYRWFMTRGMLVVDPVTQKATRLIGVTADIQERKEREEFFSHRATHDVLTELPNRALFNERLKQGVEYAKRNYSHLAVVMVDLDNFKIVNDTLGHHAGDLLLVEVAARLQKNMRESDMVSRFGGDEFALLFSFEKNDRQGISAILNRTMRTLQSPFWLEGKKFTVTASFGVSVCPEDGDDPKELLMRADEAMYHAKGAGRNACVFWKPNGLYEVLEFKANYRVGEEKI